MTGLSMRASSLNKAMLSSALPHQPWRLSAVSTRGAEVSMPGQKARPAPARITAATGVVTLCREQRLGHGLYEIVVQRIEFLRTVQGQQPYGATRLDQQYLFFHAVPP